MAALFGSLGGDEKVIGIKNTGKFVKKLVVSHFSFVNSGEKK